MRWPAHYGRSSAGSSPLAKRNSIDPCSLTDKLRKRASQRSRFDLALRASSRSWGVPTRPSPIPSKRACNMAIRLPPHGALMATGTAAALGQRGIYIPYRHLPTGDCLKEPGGLCVSQFCESVLVAADPDWAAVPVSADDRARHLRVDVRRGHLGDAQRPVARHSRYNSVIGIVAGF